MYMKTRSTRLCLSKSKACTLCVWILLGHTREMGKETTWFYTTAISYSSEEILVLAKSKCQRQAWHFQDVLKVPKRSNSNSMLADFFSPSVEKAIAAPVVFFFFSFSFMLHSPGCPCSWIRSVNGRTWNKQCSASPSSRFSFRERNQV